MVMVIASWSFVVVTRVKEFHTGVCVSQPNACVTCFQVQCDEGFAVSLLLNLPSPFFCIATLPISWVNIVAQVEGACCFYPLFGQLRFVAQWIFCTPDGSYAHVVHIQAIVIIKRDFAITR